MSATTAGVGKKPSRETKINETPFTATFLYSLVEHAQREVSHILAAATNWTEIDAADVPGVQSIKHGVRNTIEGIKGLMAEEKIDGKLQALLEVLHSYSTLEKVSNGKTLGERYDGLIKVFGDVVRVPELSQHYLFEIFFWAQELISKILFHCRKLPGTTFQTAHKERIGPHVLAKAVDLWYTAIKQQNAPNDAKDSIIARVSDYLEPPRAIPNHKIDDKEIVVSFGSQLRRAVGYLTKESFV